MGASASWEIDLFGKLRNSKRQALASLLASDAYRQAMQTQVVATVADSYYALLMLDEQIRITEQTAESWRYASPNRRPRVGANTSAASPP